MTWTGGFPSVVQHRDLEPHGDPVSKDNGEARLICRLQKYPGLLLKLYKEDIARGIDPQRIDALVTLPGRVSRAENTLLTTSTSWPVSRVVDGNVTVGVVIPEAPARYSCARVGKFTGIARTEPLEIDLLATSAEYLLDRGIDAPAPAQRRDMCVQLAGIAAVFELNGVVYADWSYANAFWSLQDSSVFVIDVDSCSFGPRPHVESNTFEDPLTQRPMPVDNYTDRYRAALLIARCLTGLRDRPEVLDALAVAAVRAGVPRSVMVLRRMLTATERTTRPSLAELFTSMRPDPPGVLARLNGSGGGGGGPNIGGWVAVSPPPRSRAPNGHGSAVLL